MMVHVLVPDTEGSHEETDGNVEQTTGGAPPRRIDEGIENSDTGTGRGRNEQDGWTKEQQNRRNKVTGRKEKEEPKIVRRNQR